ncbi:MAG: galactosyldiacylglycerol synthase [Acidobacteria bacterium]|nr:galactosyldiacylglycerol synthase [Acidobacteriota bacterium]
MIKMYNAESRELIGIINEEQLELLFDQLEEESSKSDSYYIDTHTIEYLTDFGADEELIELLKKGLGDDDGIEIYIKEESLIK